MRLISIREAARLLQVHPHTLKNNETADGNWCTVYGLKLRVYRISNLPNAQRRYDADEIERAVNRISMGPN